MKIRLNVKITTFILGAAWLCLFVIPQFRVAGHDGGPRLALTPPQEAMPGDALVIEGFNLGTDLLVTIVLEQEGRQHVLAEVLCDGHGDFAATVILPEDLPPGFYTVAAIDNSVAGVETVMASSLFRVGTVVEASQPAFPWLNLLVWAGGGLLFLILLFVGSFLRKR